MKAACFLIVLSCTSRLIAGTFVNLDFESVNEEAVVGQVTSDGYLAGVGPGKDLFPGWAKDENGNVPFNNLTDLCFGATCWSINSRDSFDAAAAYLLGQMTGNYALVFDVGAVPSGYSLTFSQRGDVPPGASDTALRILKTPFLNEPLQQLSLRFTAVHGPDYFVEYTDSLSPESSWQVLPGAPHNGGAVTDFAANPQRFYRVRSVVSGP